MTSRLSVAVLLLALSTACATPHVVRLDTGHGAPLEYRPPTTNKSVKVGDNSFKESLAQLVLQFPLSLRSPRQAWLVRTSTSVPAQVPQWQELVSKSLGGMCEPGQRRQDCLSVLDDLMGLSELDKLGIALGLSFEPLRESIAEAVEDTLAPQLFYTVIATGLMTWVVLAANPEPVFTKTAALVAAVMLIYLGVDTFLEVVKACVELKRATAKATTFEELEEASRRFGHKVGPQVARVFVLAVTVAVSQGMVGGASWLASRLPLLPNFPEAATLGASQVGLSLANVGQVSAVAVVEGNIVISLAPTAVAMAARGPGDPSGAAGISGQDPAAAATSGQQHHVISRPIAEELERHPTLRGHYTARDPRFVTRAADKASHNGYQTWHRQVDEEVIEWLRAHDQATPAEFEALLRQIYSRPQMRARFPDGF